MKLFKIEPRLVFLPNAIVDCRSIRMELISIALFLNLCRMWKKIDSRFKYADNP